MQRIFGKFPNLAVIHHHGDSARGIHISYVVRTNPLPPSLEKVIEEGYGRYALDYTFEMSRGMVDVRSLFANADNPVFIEIGFGDGKNSFEIAKENPETNYLAFDVYLHGFASYMKMLSDAGLVNVKVCRYDAEDFIRRSVADFSIDGFNIFFPDPWIKRKQSKRRLINADFASVLSSKLKNGGIIHLATDIEPYAEQMLSILSSDNSLTNAFDGYAPCGIYRHGTSFELKGKEAGRRAYDIVFTKSGSVFARPIASSPDSACGRRKA